MQWRDDTTLPTAALRDFNPTFVRFGSAADIASRLGSVRFTPESGQTADISVCPLCAKSGQARCNKKAQLFDHLVRAGKQRRRHFEPERLRGLQVDNKL